MQFKHDQQPVSAANLSRSNKVTMVLRVAGFIGVLMVGAVVTLARGNEPLQENGAGTTPKSARPVILTSTSLVTPRIFRPASTATITLGLPPSIPPVVANRPQPTVLRDPFLAPVSEDEAGSSCRNGRRCLAVDDLTLQGVVRSGGRFLAVVVTAGDQVYFLHEQDAIRNGRVMKIGPDSIVFRVYAVGQKGVANGTFHDHDVVRRLAGSPAA